PADDAALAHREKLQSKALPLAVKAEDVDITLGRDRHFLLIAELQNGAVQVAEFCCQLEFVLLGVVPHSPFEVGGKLLVTPLEQGTDVAGGLNIFILRAEPFYTWAEATFEMVFEAGPRQFAVDLDIACAKLKRAIDQVKRLA